MSLILHPVNFGELGIQRKTAAPIADIRRVYEIYPELVLCYEQACDIVGLERYGGGTLDMQASHLGMITSGFRSEIIGGNKESAHRYAAAFDVAVGVGQVMLDSSLAFATLFNRIGIYPDKQFIHADAMPDAWIREHNKARFWIVANNETRTFETFSGLVSYFKLNFL